MDEPLIDRGEVVGLLFGVTEIASLKRIEELLEDENGEEETDS